MHEVYTMHVKPIIYLCMEYTMHVKPIIYVYFVVLLMT